MAPYLGTPLNKKQSASPITPAARPPREAQERRRLSGFGACEHTQRAGVARQKAGPSFLLRIPACSRS